jgi:hypothetical protein
MKLLVVLILLMNSAIGLGQSAEFFVKERLHKFPKTLEGVQLKHTYEISNTGKAPLIISSYKVACPCTKVTLPGPIQPGETGYITLAYDTNGKSYVQDRKIILQTNTLKGEEYLRFKVYVIPNEE